MKNRNILLLLVMLCAIPIVTYAQEADVCGMSFIEEESHLLFKSSICNPATSVCWGRYKPAQDTLRVLMVYVRFEDDSQSMSYWNSWPNPNNVWEAENWMKNSVDSLASNMSNNYMNITNYFRTMSHNQFIVLGDVVYVEAPSIDTFSPLTNLSLMKAVNTWVLEYLDQRIDLSKYDNYEYLGANNHEKKSDDILDMVYMIYRTPGTKHFAGPAGGNFGGIAQLGNSGSVTLNSGKIVNFGFGGNGSGLTIHMENDKQKRFDDSYIHELAHYLMGGNHPYTDGSYSSSVGRTGYWGIFGGNQATNSVNAYEQEQLGWITPTELTSTTSFTLSDFVTTGASYKYTISPTEFYNFENRQKVQSTTGIDDTYDQPNWNDDDKGLFVLHVKENASGNYLYASDNSLESVVSDGNWEWEMDVANSWQSGVCHANGEPAFYKNVPDRFGESFKDPIMLVDNPNDTKGSYMQTLFVKASNPTQCKKYFLGYSYEDKSGFTETKKSLITPYTNPAFLKRNKTQVGIGMKITGKTGSSLNMKFFDTSHDFYTITENTTWDGQIFLEESVTIQSGAKLTIKPGTTVYLDEGVSINVSGELHASSTIFTAMDTNWGRINFNSGSEGFLNKVTIEKAKSYGGAAVYISNAGSNPIQILESTIKDCAGACGGVYVNNSANVYVYDTLIENNTSDGIVAYNSSVRVLNSFIDLNSGQTGVLSNSYSNVLFSAVTAGYYAGENTIAKGKYGIKAGYQATLTAGSTVSFASQNRIANQNGSGWAHINTTSPSAVIYAKYNFWKPYNGGGGGAPIVSGSGTVYASPHLTSDPNPGIGFKQVAPLKEELGEIGRAIVLNYEENYKEASAILKALIEHSKKQEIIQQSLIQYGWIARLSGEREYSDYLEALSQKLVADDLEAALQGVLATVYFSRGETDKALEKLDYINHVHKETEHAFQASVLAAYVAEESGNRRKANQYFQQASSNVSSMSSPEKERLLSDVQFYLNSKSLSDTKELFPDESALKSENPGLVLSNYPNPFNPVTNIVFTLPMKSQVSLTVYDMLGREVAVLVNGELPAGEQTIRFDASNLANGMYLYKLQVNNQELVQKMTLIK